MGGRERERGWGREMPEGRDRHRARDLVAARVYPGRTHIAGCWKMPIAGVHRPSWPSTTVGSMSALSFYERGEYFWLRLFSGNQINAELKVDDVDLSRLRVRVIRCN